MAAGWKRRLMQLERRLLPQAQQARRLALAQASCVLLACFFVYLLVSFTQHYVLVHSEAKGRRPHPLRRAMPTKDFDVDKHTEFGNEKSIGVICRFYQGSTSDVIAIVSNFQSQEKLRQLGLSIVVYLVPTEPVDEASLHSLTSVLDSITSSPLARTTVSYRIHEVNADVYSDLWDATRRLCTKQFKHRYLSEGGNQPALDRYCSINSYLHYTITDLALDRLLKYCYGCMYILITNADNGYTPDFLASAVQMAQDGGYDMIMSNFIDRKRLKRVRMRIAYMDLGGTLLTSSLLKRTKMTFLKAAGSFHDPQNLHDADFWLAYKLQEAGATIGIMEDFGFMHN